MEQKYYMGIDISKSKIDCAVMDGQFRVLLEQEVPNEQGYLTIFFKKLFKSLKIHPAELLVCCENTGIYNRPLERVSQRLGFGLWVEHALKIKRASTDYRGKDDRKDALRIAEYAIRYSDRQYLYREPSENIQKINVLSKSRETLLNTQVALENQLREAKSHDTFEHDLLQKSYVATLATVKKSISEIEQQIDLLTRQDESMRKHIELAMTVPGVGLQTAIKMIVITNNFTSFRSAKHLACYAGVVPFKNESGTIKKKQRVSKMANQDVKKLLHLAAMAAIRVKGELQDYYLRKVGEGKNKMSVLNAIRNKIAHRIMAVINRGEGYMKETILFNQKNEKMSCLLS